jgi:ABC-type antimicrobial peptide transport system permease subunit
MSLQTGAKLENEALHARLVFIVGVIMAVTFAIMVIGLLFGMLFVNMPAELSPLDGSIVDLLSTISVFLTGALSGLVASNGIKKNAKVEAE